MHIIPVIDLLNGQVVHAKRGDRQNYLPIQSSLCPSSEPRHVLNALLELYPFNCVYIADINAIQKNGDHFELVNDLKKAYPEIDFWLDAGFDSIAGIQRASGLSIVLGTESLRDLAHYRELSKACDRHILSLDFKAGTFSGPQELLETSDFWPEKIIAMSLSKVGSNSGPDIEQLLSLQKMALRQKIHAAGGVRDFEDLKQLNRMQVHGALIASALHAGKINPAQISELE